MGLVTRKPVSRLPLLSLLVALMGSQAYAQEQTGAPDLATRASQMRARPGDRVAVHVYGDPTFSDAATLDEKGRIMLPRIGLIQADAMTIAELRDTVRARLSTILRDPAIEVAVQRRIIVSGEVMKPGVYYADLTTSIGEMVAEAGGLKETAKASKVDLIRGTERRRIAQWESDQSPGADLHSGDQILVGRMSWLELNIIPFAGVSMAVVSLIITVRQSLRKGP
jgi:protein involved in polysaccharide export with SLBB domain